MPRSVIMWCSPLLLLLAVSSARKIDLKENVSINWSQKHTFKALKVSLTAGLTQDIEFWYDEHRSRTDYINGVSKVFKFDDTVPGAAHYGTEYGIHPVTIANEENKMVCMYKNGNSEEPIYVAPLLPYTNYDFEVIGHGIISDMTILKLYYKIYGADDSTHKNTLWVSKDQKNSDWIPVRFESQVFSNRLGNLKDHDIWVYYNYATNFTEEVFNPKTYVSDCIKIGVDDETEELDLEMEELVDTEFEKFKTANNRKYRKGDDEYKKRKEIFKGNLRLMNERNSQNLGYTLAINQFSDRTEAELLKHQGLITTNQETVGNIPFPYTQETLKSIADTLPDDFDLRLSGVINPVMSQGECGCCWSIAATAALEGALAQHNGGKLLSLSNQALIDCTWSYGRAHGCDGGSIISAYLWMMDYGLPTVEDYGIYSGQDNYCKIENITRRYPIKGHSDVTPSNVDALKVAVMNHGPVSVLLHVTEAFRMYSSGIFFDANCDTTHFTHAATVVGFGKKDGATFWILKNSWGANWGIDGYMHISTMDDACGVAMRPTYVTV